MKKEKEINIKRERHNKKEIEKSTGMGRERK
jgi:hypothetical protein